MTSPLSRSVEDYLKTIYQLTERGDDAATTEIAQRLNIAPASVTGMVTRMAEAGLLAHQPYHGVQLTDEGRTAALAVMRRHRILETYLITKLGYDWANVHDEAERLEHAVSDDLVERMAFALGQPQYDPHGAPIPTRDGQIEKPSLVALETLEVNERATLRQVGDDDSERLRYLKSIGLTPMVPLSIVDRQPFGGPITIRVGATDPRDQVIGPELAACLFVERS